MFTKDLEMCLMAAQSEAIERRHEYLCVEHILYALLHNDAGLNVIQVVEETQPSSSRIWRISFLNRKNLMETSCHDRHVPFSVCCI